jgi:hypothetical protein
MIQQGAIFRVVELLQLYTTLPDNARVISAGITVGLTSSRRITVDITSLAPGLRFSAAPALYHAAR